jgi:hypothetical protein
MYDDLLDDPKVQRLDPVLFKTWVNLLCLASRNDGVLPSVDDVAFALRLGVDSVWPRLHDLVDRGLLDKNESGEYRPHNWDKRQYKSDNSTERSKKHRATAKQQDVQQPCNVAATPPDTEQNRTEEVMSETSSDAPQPEKKKRAKNDYPQDFQTFYAAYPADPGMSKPEALKAWLKLPDDDRDKALKAIPAFKVWVSKQGKDYRTVHACRYLSQRRFEGFEASVNVTTENPGVLVKRGSDAWEAWQKVKRTPYSERYDGWWFPSQFPPNTEARAA